MQEAEQLPQAPSLFLLPVRLEQGHPSLEVGRLPWTCCVGGRAGSRPGWRLLCWASAFLPPTGAHHQLPAAGGASQGRCVLPLPWPQPLSPSLVGTSASARQEAGSALRARMAPSLRRSDNPADCAGGQDAARLLDTTATSQWTSGVWPPGWPRSSLSGQGEVYATAGCRGEAWPCCQRCRAGSCGHVPSASWVSSEDWSGASPAGPARRPWPGPKAFFLEEAVATPHWVRDT